MQVYSEKSKSTVGATEIQKRERYKFWSNTAFVMATVHKAIWRECHWKQRLQNADNEKVQFACTWYRPDNPLHCSLCDISFTKCICIYLYMLWFVYALYGLFSLPITTCTVNHLSITVSVLPSVAPLSTALFLYRYYVRLCPSVGLKLGQLWNASYEMWRLCLLLNAIQWYKFNA